ncbi:MAG: hypothetical protein A3K19_01005 [Lentisphaerae bacterium RIFOXYB12_FULL_65_16]|nr:MAG: hypothetical protein A3K18_24075 [Lentisphaerae bacterium RIFOXYA12_64_32]OGV90547.1 MAG: hypothetical protein A3K19_01005 [Lentisphaerae bacterium RIFOXYB12_FULL_65_16]
MTIVESRQGDVLILKVKDRLDSTTAGAFEKHVTGAIEGGSRLIVLDCAELNYVSSAGLRAFLTGAKLAKSKQGRLVIGCPQVQVKEILDMTGFSGILPISATLEAAVAACS